MKDVVRRKFALWGVALVMMAFVQAAGADPKEPQLASATARELWRKGSDQVLAGDFNAAYATLEQVQRIEPGHAEVTAAINWMRDARTLAESRERFRARNYEFHVNQALKATEEARAAPNDERSDKSAKAEKKPKPEKPKDGEEKDEEDDKGYKWSKALNYANAALLNAKDEETFRREPWLKEIVDNVLLEIDRHKEAHEWRDALVLYDLLQRIYPKNKEYEAGISFCTKRAHLDYVYGPKSNWRSDLRDVNKDVLPQIFDRIEDDYVVDPDFRKMCSGGLEHLILLAEAESLTSTFPTLGDRDLVRAFVTRLKGLIKTRIQGKSSLSARQLRSIFIKVMEANEASLRLPEAVLVDEFVSGALEPLDEFTSVIWPAEVDEFNKHTRGDFVGVGIQITQEPGKHVRVESPLEESPAYRAGIKPGDMITHVDGKNTIDITINQAVSMITGEPGTKVALTIEDSGTKKSRDITLTREHIKLRTVRGHTRDEHKATGWDYMIDPANRVGYVRVSGFMDKTVEDLAAALDQMRDEGCKGLILDLRFNPGGLLTSAVKMCELFVGENEPIVQTKGRSRAQNMELRSKGPADKSRIPIVVLVNEYSASASEIVAGALAGLKGACVVGTRTYGKGSVQNLIPIADNQAYLKLTTAHYYVPDTDHPSDPWYLLHKVSGAEIWGIDPHIEVKVIPQEIGKILRLRRERDLLKGRDQDAIPKEVLERRPTSEPAEELPKDEDPEVDPQITAALNVMRIKLLSNQPWALAPRSVRALSHADSATKDQQAASR